MSDGIAEAATAVPRQHARSPLLSLLAAQHNAAQAMKALALSAHYTPRIATAGAPAHVVARRRAANKVARRSRRINRKTAR